MLDDEYFFFLSGCTGTWEERRKTIAKRRILYIANLIGREVVQKTLNEARDELEKKQDPKLWDIFLHGTPEQREQVFVEFNRKLRAESLATPDQATTKEKS